MIQHRKTDSASSTSTERSTGGFSARYGDRMAGVKDLLSTKKELLEKVATSLLEKETLESEEFLELLGASGRETEAKPAAPEGKET